MHPIENILQITMSELKEIVDVNTIVGDAFVTPTGSTVSTEKRSRSASASEAVRRRAFPLCRWLLWWPIRMA